MLSRTNSFFLRTQVRQRDSHVSRWLTRVHRERVSYVSTQASLVVQPRPLGLSLYPAVSGGRDIVLGDRFRTKLAYTPPLLTTSIELGCKKKQNFYRTLQPSSTLVVSCMLAILTLTFSIFSLYRSPHSTLTIGKSFGVSTSFLHRFLIWLHARPMIISLAGGGQVFQREQRMRDPEAVVQRAAHGTKSHMKIFSHVISCFQNRIRIPIILIVQNKKLYSILQNKKLYSSPLEYDFLFYRIRPYKVHVFPCRDLFQRSRI